MVIILIHIISTVIRDISCKNKNNKLKKILKKVLFTQIYYLGTQYYLRYIILPT